MTGNIVAGRYAKALFALANEEGMSRVEAYGQNLADLAGLIKESPPLKEVLHNPLFSAEEKESLLTRLLKELGAEKQVVDFCLLLAVKGRVDLLLDIQARYSDMLDQAKGVLRGKLITAVTLDEAKGQAIAKSLEQRSGHSIILDFEVDPAILGGVVLQVGDKILDASLRAQLGLLRQNITRGE